MSPPTRALNRLVVTQPALEFESTKRAASVVEGLFGGGDKTKQENKRNFFFRRASLTQIPAHEAHRDIHYSVKTNQTAIAFATREQKLDQPTC